MKNEIEKFNFNNNEVRIKLINNEAYLCVLDIRNILGIPQNSRLIQDLTKGFIKSELLTKGGKQDVYFCCEKDFYKISLRSNSKIAEPFQDWVCGEVLPSIRKTGSYSTTPQPQPTPTYTPKELVEIFLELCPFFKNRKIYRLKHFYKMYCGWLDHNKVDRKFFGDGIFKTALFRNGFHFIELEKDVGCFYIDIADYNYINSEYDIALYYQHHIKTQEYRENAGLVINDSLSLITSRETINEVIDTMVEEKTIELINEYKRPVRIKNDINYNIEHTPYYYNIVNQFITERLSYDVSSAISCFELYNIFRKWCFDKSINPITHNKFGRGLYSFGTNKTYVNGDLKGYGGIKLNDKVEA